MCYSEPSVHVPEGAAPTSVFLVLHGYGANARDLELFAHAWRAQLKETAFISLPAPYAFDDQGTHRYWFTLEDLNLVRIRREIQNVTPFIKEKVEAYLKTWGLSWSDVIVAGFSQGGAVALSLSLYELETRGTVVYSGLFVPFPEETLKHHTKVCLIHGDADEVVPIGFFEESRKHMEQHDISFESWVSKGLGHSIDSFGLEKGCAFMKAVLAAPLSLGQ